MVALQLFKEKVRKTIPVMIAGL